MELKAKHLILALLGNATLDPMSPPISASTFTKVLAQLGVAKSAVRAALNRMVEQGQLTSERSGRTVSYRITAELREILEEARQRLFAEAPFESSGPGWTLIAVSVPESRRAERHRLGVILAWRGFAPLWNGLWIAPGPQIVDDLMRDFSMDAGGSQFMAFDACSEQPRISVEQAAVLWNLEDVRRAHEAFIARWEEPPAVEASALALHAWLIGEWTQLIRRDPRLSQIHLPARWPAARSAEVFRTSMDRLYNRARDEFNNLEPEHKPEDS